MEEEEEVIGASEEALMDRQVEEGVLKGSMEDLHQACRVPEVPGVILEVHPRGQGVTHPTHHKAPEATHHPEVSHLKPQGATLQQAPGATQDQEVATLHPLHQEDTLPQHPATQHQEPQEVTRHQEATQPLSLGTPQQLQATLTTLATQGITVEPTDQPLHQVMTNTAEENPQDPERDPDPLPEMPTLATKRGAPERDGDPLLPETGALLRVEKRGLLEERREALDVVTTVVSRPEAAERITLITPSTPGTLVTQEVLAVATPCTLATLATPLLLVQRMLPEALPHLPLLLPLLPGTLRIR